MQCYITYFVQYALPGIGCDVSITRWFLYFYTAYPTFPKYIVAWYVGKVFRLLATWLPLVTLSTKYLSLKPVALKALSSCGRAQTLHALSVENVDVSAHGVVFVVPRVLRTSRRGQPAQIVDVSLGMRSR